MTVSVLEKIVDELRENRTYKAHMMLLLLFRRQYLRRWRTWVAIYAREAVVTEVIPWIRALLDLVAFATSPSTELGEVKTCL